MEQAIPAPTPQRTAAWSPAAPAGGLLLCLRLRAGAALRHLCEATGFNGKTLAQGATATAKVSGLQAARRRSTTAASWACEFTSTVMPGLPWEMRPLRSASTAPGRTAAGRFLVRNTVGPDHRRPGRAQRHPGAGAQHFEKIDCFCFSQQTLAPGEAAKCPCLYRQTRGEPRHHPHHAVLRLFQHRGQPKTLTRLGRPDERQHATTAAPHANTTSFRSPACTR
jgi:cytochrome c oxidase assembly protein subunit 11